MLFYISNLLNKMSQVNHQASTFDDQLKIPTQGYYLVYMQKWNSLISPCDFQSPKLPLNLTMVNYYAMKDLLI